MLTEAAALDIDRAALLATSPHRRSGGHPRRLVAVGTGIVVIALLALSTVILSRADRALGSIDYVRTSTQASVDHLDDALAANAAGEMQLLQAAASTGETRSTFLARSIESGEDSGRAWTNYTRVARDLPGTATLEARYRRNHQAGKDLAATAIMSILQSDAPGDLPPSQLAAAEGQRQDLIELRELHQAESNAALHALQDDLTRAIDRVVGFTVAASAVLLLAGFFCWRWASRVVADREARFEASEFAEFESRLGRALSMVDDDHQALELAAKAAAEIEPDAVASIVLSDASGASFRAVAGETSCGVTDPLQCPAMRAGAPMRFADSTALDACPLLAASSAAEPCSVTCMPISVAGRDVALLQLTGAAHDPPAMSGSVQLVVRRVGERITMMRAFAQVELRASRDPLTGLLNRRSLSDAVELLDANGQDYAVGFADMDHFKLLNDVHGHDAGDRALRRFAHTLAAGLRPQDLCCRWGGEEFLVVLPDCHETEAVVAMERVRSMLALRSQDGLTAPVTVSIGVAQHARPGAFAETVERADAALRRAKESGRDQVALWVPNLVATSAPG